ncbi:MAG: right-handed parallel beta-helix repeat-containing protein [Euryarchaeota archaeon]|nr:right-handed parallel beta-helix repeat-containing protein [Euryarchaeota archaeon]
MVGGRGLPSKDGRYGSGEEGGEMRVILASLVLLFSLFLAGSVSAQTTNVSNCTTISSPGVYVLNQSITNSANTTCIEIISSNVTFDGAGYTIDGNDTAFTYGVYVYNSSTTLTNVTVKNLTVTDWSRGIYYQNAQNGSIANNTANSNSFGIYLSSSSNNTLTNNTASSSSATGIVLYSSSNNTLTNNTASSNSNGIYLGYSDSSTLTNNNMTNNTRNFLLEGNQDSHFNNSIDTSNAVDGKPIYYIKNGANTVYNSSSNAGIFYCIWCSNVTIRDLTFTKNGYGVLFWSTNNSRIENITTSSNSYDGIHLSSSNSNTISNNNASSNQYGIVLSSSNSSTLTNNTASSNTMSGIYLRSSSTNNTLTNNKASSNTQYGIYLLSSSTNNTLTNNTANSNCVGIYLLSSSTNNTLTNNTANSNSCSGIYLYSSGNSTLTNNKASSNTQNGVYLYSSSSSTLTNNTASNNTQEGIYLYLSGNSTLTNNTASSNTRSGIYLLSSNSSTLTNNTAKNNTMNGIYLNSSSSSTLNNNTASSNEDYGIWLCLSVNTTLNKNTARSNKRIGIRLCYSSKNSTLTNDTASDNTLWDYSATDNIANGTTGVLLDTSSFAISATASNASSANVGVNLTPASSANATTISLPDVNTTTADRDRGVKYLNMTNATSLENVSRVATKVYYADDEISSLNESTLCLLYWNGTRWLCTINYVNSTIPNGPFVYDAGRDTTNNYVYAETSKFSVYGVAGNIITTSSPSTPSAPAAAVTSGAAAAAAGGPTALTPTPAPTTAPPVTPTAAAPPAPQFQAAVTSIMPGDVGRFTIPPEGRILVTELGIRAAKEITSGTVEGKTVDRPAVAPAPGDAFKYIQFTTDIGSEKIEYVDITFRVEKSWISANSIDANAVALHRYADDKWSKLPTSRASEDAVYVYYTARSPGFSYFAISGEKVPVVVTPAPAPPVTTPAAPPTTAPPVTTPAPKKGICGPSALIAIAVLVNYLSPRAGRRASQQRYAQGKRKE